MAEAVSPQDVGLIDRLVFVLLLCFVNGLVLEY